MNRKIAGLSLILVLGIIVTCCYVVQGRMLSRSSVPLNHSSVPLRKAGLASSILGGRNTDYPAANPNGIYYKNQVIVLMYHEVVRFPKDKDNGALPLSSMEEQIKLMKANNFHWITMEQYARFILHGEKIPDNAVLMTFDDGYESFYTDTYPLLKKYHIPATSFLIVNTVSNPHHAGIPKVTWAQVQQMHKNGIDFYNHTFDSHYYASFNSSGSVQRAVLADPVYLKDKKRRESPKEYEQRVTKDLTLADDILQQKLGNTYKILAFPYGAYSKPLMNIVRKLGIDVTFTVKSGINGPGETNGFRVNAGGMEDNPQALIAMMEKGQAGVESKTAGDGASRSFYFQMLVLVTALMAVLTLRLLAGNAEEKYGWRYFFWKRSG
ncbi:polysaccharide deacetylase family protein [Paenibacillus sp. sptzw28]|uniref:polysaccharide deacetylase family protein n=1 Tax=Paenibacillus sp. sptzw28 TaxID=715179 RepID=UPI001C6E4443|nr:polysaccharide deacetylase family protein [Paenibacillus sp. sptzw28]QYR21555.1 polysaccharide deacetylase family protein [Paenibacillus sp. sptzw28]